MKYQVITVKMLCNESTADEACLELEKSFPYAEWSYYEDGEWYLIDGAEAGEVESPADFQLYEDDVEEVLSKILVCEYYVYTNYGGFDGY